MAVIGSGVWEIRVRDHKKAYRVLYLAKHNDGIHVLHAFQKKSKRGMKTPQQDIDLIKTRLKQAEARHGDWKKQQTKKRNSDRGE